MKNTATAWKKYWESENNDVVLLSGQLDKISKQVAQLADQPQAGNAWDRQALEVLNEEVHRLLSGLVDQLEQWQWEVKAREELQTRLLDQPPHSERITALWWDEQITFYQGLIERIDHAMRYDEDARITVSLRAQELLLLIKLLVEEGVVQTKTLTPIFRHLSRYFGTARYSNLSFDSLKKRYSLRHENTRKEVKQLLNNMIKRIDRIRNDDS